MPSTTEEREKFVGLKLKKKEVKSVLHENVVLRLPSNDLFRSQSSLSQIQEDGNVMKEK